MSKKEFLKELEKRLQILADSERKDILNEYKDNIEEKIKHGKTEKEAVADFGDLDDLCKEILSAYKINPEYGEAKEEIGDKAKKVIKESESLIKQCAKKLSDFTKGVVEDIKKNDQEITVEFIFEIIIKALIFLVICALLRIPFWLIQQLGGSILDILFPPLDTVFGVIWTIVLGFLYFLVCVFIAIGMFREYFHKVKKDSEDIKEDKVDEKVEVKEEKKPVKTKKKTIAETESQPVVVKKSRTNDIVDVLLKVFVGVFILLPVWCLLLVVWVVIALTIYYLWQGLPLWGILIMLIGGNLLLCSISDLFYRLVFTRKKLHPFTSVIAIIVIIIGGLATAHTVSKIDYYNVAPIVDVAKVEKVYTEQVDGLTKIDVNHGSVEIITDNEIEPGTIVIRAYYYESYNNYVYYRDQSKDGSTDYIRIQTSRPLGKVKDRYIYYDLVIDNLKDYKFYNYGKLQDVEVKVYVNEQTKGLIR